MSKRFLVLGTAWLWVLLLVACGGDGKQGPPSASHPAADLRVVDRRPLDIPDLNDLSLSISPDGEWLAGVNQDGALCIYTADSLHEERCTLLDTCQADPRSVAWAPDSRRVAVAENMGVYFESDLWVLELETGKLVNLTDDGVSACERQGDAGPTPIDFSPTWSPDGKALAFFRLQGDEKGLYRMPAGGGAAEELANGLGIAYMLWSKDGKIVYTPQGAALDESGLWLIGPGEPGPRQVIGADPELGPPFLMDVSPAGDKALVIYRLAAARDFFSQPNRSYCAVVDVKTGQVEPLKQATGAAPEFYGPMAGAFSPAGSKVLYVYQDANAQARLAVRDLGGGAENVLLTMDKVEVFAGPGHGLDWAGNDTLVLPFSHLLLRVGVE